MSTSEKKKIRWGLLGAGAILNRWMQGARQAEDMEIVAVASRTIQTATDQAQRWKIPEAMTYDEMLRRQDLDIVYIPVPHTAHKELALKAMNAGKNVLVEKPAGICAGEWEEMCTCAKENDVFLMEGAWTRCFPVIPKLQKALQEGIIGQVRLVQSAFAYRIADDYQGRLTDPERAGGALLDVGVYNMHFNQLVFGKNPVRLAGLASQDTDGLHLQVDEQDCFIGQYEDGAMSLNTCAIRTQMPDTAYIYGTKGYLAIPHFWKPTRVDLYRQEGNADVPLPVTPQIGYIEEAVPQHVPGMEDEGYQYEIRHVNECLRRGLKESWLVPWAATLDVLRQCDQLRSG